MAKATASTQRSLAFLAVTALVLCGSAAWFFAPRAKNVDAAHSAATATSAAQRVASAAQGSGTATPAAPPFEAQREARAPAAVTSANDNLDEAALMTQLRELRSGNPSLALKLAREGNRRFAESADAAERTWIIVKTLTDLGRHEEARAEGRVLVERYRGTSWAEDAYRHLFVNPPTHPFERGYGKNLESDP